MLLNKLRAEQEGKMAGTFTFTAENCSGVLDTRQTSGVSCNTYVDNLKHL